MRILPSGPALPMLIVKSNCGVGHREQSVFGEVRVLGVIIAVQHLRHDLQSALDVVAHPFALQFRTGVVPAKIIYVRQSPKINRLDESAAVMMKIELRPIFRQRKRLNIHVEPGASRSLSPVAINGQ